MSRGLFVILVCHMLLFPCGTCKAQDDSRNIEQADQQVKAADQEILRFDINGFEIEGSTLLKVESVSEAVRDFVGEGKTVDDIEKAREALEKSYHEAGYPTVFVNIPEQKIGSGIIHLEVIESKIGKVKITGNRYHTMELIRKSLPSLQTDGIVHTPAVQAEINKLNRSKDIQVIPSLAPGRELGTVDVDLKVEDRRSLHGYTELNNRSSHDTTELRLNAALSYENLWQKQHCVSFQYQTAPLDPGEVQVFAGSYSLPAPWNRDHYLVLYGVLSDSDTASGEGFQTVGKGSMIGMRYIMPLPSYKRYAHSFNIGIDYKEFQELHDLGSGNSGSEAVPITYLPLSVSYSASLQDPWGITAFSGGLNVAFRGLVTSQEEFQEKRYQARGDYLYVRLGMERLQKLPGGFGLFLKVDGQIADQPLINNEQYAAGGMESVRGYKEVEVLGDWGIHTTVELQGPDLANLFHIQERRFGCIPFLFYDFASLGVLDPLPEQTAYFELQGVGGGIRGQILKRIEYDAAVGFALNATEKTEAGESRGYFKLRYGF